MKDGVFGRHHAGLWLAIPVELLQSGADFRLYRFSCFSFSIKFTEDRCLSMPAWAPLLYISLETFPISLSKHSSVSSSTVEAEAGNKTEVGFYSDVQQSREIKKRKSAFQSYMSALCFGKSSRRSSSN